MIDVGKERHKLIKKTVSKGVSHGIFHIPLNSIEIEENVNVLNETITNAMLESLNRYYPTIKKESKISEATIWQMQHGKDLKGAKMTTAEDLRQTNKEISKAVRPDIRKFN